MRAIWFLGVSALLALIVVAVVIRYDDDPGDWGGALAVGAAILAAGIVAWQSWETRRSAAASESAARAALDALGVAQEALTVARDEESNSRDLIKESIRSRVDAGIPTLAIVPKVADWPPSRFTEAPRAQHRNAAVAQGEYYLSEPGDPFFAMPCVAEIWNESDRHVTIRIGRMPIGGGPFEEWDHTLAPRDHVSVQFEVWHQFRRWVKEDVSLDDFWHDGAGEGRPSLLAVRHEQPGDTGAVDSWSIRVEGTLFEPIPHRDGGFSITERPDKVFLRPHMDRVYVRSFRRGQNLDED